MTPPRLIASQGALAELLTELRQENVLAVDTEAASFHRHIDRIYLIQVSSRTSTAIIDPARGHRPVHLRRVLADPEIEIVFHDADYDLRLFDLQYGFRATRIFDTRVAAELLERAGLEPCRPARAGTWASQSTSGSSGPTGPRGPLSPEMLAYAAGTPRTWSRCAT